MFQYQNTYADNRYAAWKKDSKNIPIKYSYDGVEYNGFPFELKAEKVDTAPEKETITRVFSVDKNFEITAIFTHYYDYGVNEITVWFENIGKENSGVLENVRFDTKYDAKNPVMRGIYGDHQNQYKPYAFKLTNWWLDSQNGRATHINFPYFNLEHDNGGVMLAIGWSGRWEILFDNEKVNGERIGKVRYNASYAMGLQTYLKPGEKIRSPLFVEAHYSVRDEFYATNYWRSWFMKYNLPKADAQGNELKPFSTVSLAGDTGLDNMDGSVSESTDAFKRSFERFTKEDIQIDFRWMDAGYYPDPSGKTHYEDWSYVGAWVFDENKWGKEGVGFKETVELAHEKGMKTLIWVEPERVCMVDDLVKNYGYNADWALPRFPKDYPFYEMYISNNFGDPDCLAWTESYVLKMLKDNKIDMFREDYNRDPVYGWTLQDKKEQPYRWGITECKAVTAHYQFWQDVIACTSSYGGCAFVDSCASGGGRNDIQSLRYAVPILRSDADRTTISLRLSMTNSFSKWVPFHGACHLEKEAHLECLQDGAMNVYAWRASYLPILNICGGRFSTDENYDYDMLRYGINEWKKVNPYLTKDFYPLTPWNNPKDDTTFAANAYIDNKKAEGVLLAFRMTNCKEDTLCLDLPFNKDDSFVFIDEDTGEQTSSKDGKLTLLFANPHEAKLLWIKKKN